MPIKSVAKLEQNSLPTAMSDETKLSTSKNNNDTKTVQNNELSTPNYLKKVGLKK